jgi:hypothetical protein
MRHVLIALDGSEFTEQVLDPAARSAKIFSTLARDDFILWVVAVRRTQRANRLRTNSIGRAATSST